jgi:hypothetical protein
MPQPFYVMYRLLISKTNLYTSGDADLDSSAWARHNMNVLRTAIWEVLIIELKVSGDPRGFFIETFKADRFATHGIRGPFVDDNLSRSSYRALRGLHLQNPKQRVF